MTPRSILIFGASYGALLGARLALSERYSLRLAGHVQWALPYAAIHFVDTQVASTGHPNLALSLAVGASL